MTTGVLIFNEIAIQMVTVVLLKLKVVALPLAKPIKVAGHLGSMVVPVRVLVILERLICILEPIQNLQALH